jgi:hypothetical protein
MHNLASFLVINEGLAHCSVSINFPLLYSRMAWCILRRIFSLCIMLVSDFIAKCVSVIELRAYEIDSGHMEKISHPIHIWLEIIER